ncbi:MAG: hypothetical protein RR221_00265 [Alistipes sp.]
MKTISRIVKYFLSLCVLSSLLIALLYAVGMAAGTPADLFYILLYTTKGWIFLGAVALLSILYPRIGFTTVHIRGKMSDNQPQIAEALRIEGFELVNETEGVVTFRATKTLQRIRLRFDDAITVQQEGEWIAIEGARKVVTLVKFRMESGKIKHE